MTWREFEQKNLNFQILSIVLIQCSETNYLKTGGLNDSFSRSTVFEGQELESGLAGLLAGVGGGDLVRCLSRGFQSKYWLELLHLNAGLGFTSSVGRKTSAPCPWPSPWGCSSSLVTKWMSQCLLWPRFIRDTPSLLQYPIGYTG